MTSFSFLFIFTGSLKKLFIYLLAVLGLLRCKGFSLVVVSGGNSSCSVRTSPGSGFSCCGAQARGHSGFSSCGSWTLEHRLGSCDAQAELLQGMWDLPIPGIEPPSPALAHRFFTTEPPGKPSSGLFLVWNTGVDTCAYTRAHIQADDWSLL